MKIDFLSVQNEMVIFTKYVRAKRREVLSYPSDFHNCWSSIDVDINERLKVAKFEIRTNPYVLFVFTERKLSNFKSREIPKGDYLKSRSNIFYFVCFSTLNGNSRTCNIPSLKSIQKTNKYCKFRGTFSYFLSSVSFFHHYICLLH